MTRKPTNARASKGSATQISNLKARRARQQKPAVRANRSACGAPGDANESFQATTLFEPPASTNAGATATLSAQAALAEAEARWNFALQGTGQGVWDADILNKKTYYSPTWREMRGFGLDEDIDGDPEVWLQRVHPDDRDRLRETIRKQDSGEIPYNYFEYRERLPDGRYIWIESRGKPVAWDESGRPIRAVGVDTDITARKELELQANNNLHLLNTTLENFPGGICMFDKNLYMIVANQSYYDLMQVDQDRFPVGSKMEDIRRFHAERGEYGPGDVEQLVAERMGEAQTFTPLTYTRTRPDDGATIEVKRTPLEGGGYVVTFEDVTEKLLSEQKIKHLAHHDGLTNLPNRMTFYDRMVTITRRVRPSETVGVLCLDLDNFKAVNDTLGHPIGDLLLQTAAKRMQNCLRGEDMVARLGGDEFAILQISIEKPADITALATRLIEVVGAPYDLDNHQVVVGVSVGIAIAPGDGDDPDTLMKNADLALYRAKADGGGVYRFFETEMDARMRARRVIELDLRRAIIGGDEFELEYQPIIDVKTGKITSCEALVRWHHPERGLVMPMEFIPVAEATGLIVPLGEWVLRQACEEAARWPKDIMIAVNVSPAQFKSKSFVPAVTDALVGSGLPAGRLEIEITELVLLNESDDAFAILHQLRDLGINIAIDDFGTGYSSLGYLRSFPFNTIKIDQSFIRELPDKAHSRAIVRAVVALSTGLGIKTVAEGVETARQLASIVSEGCTQSQGFFFSKPCPSTKARQLLNEQATTIAAA